MRVGRAPVNDAMGGSLSGWTQGLPWASIPGGIQYDILCDTQPFYVNTPYHKQTTGEWLDLSSPEGQAKVCM